MEVIVVEVEGEEGGAVVAGVVGTGIGPLTSEGLDEAFGLAIGLGTVRSGEVVAEAELVAGLGEEFGAIGGAAVGEDALDLDAMSFVEGEGLLESREHAGGLFIGEQRGESQAGVVVDGDVEGLDAGAGIAVGTVAGGADAGLVEAAQFLDIEVKEFAWGGAFVADDGRLGRVERSEAIETVALENAGESGFGDGKDHEDLGVGAALAAQCQDPGFELGAGLARLAPWDRGAIVEALGEAGVLSALEPLADGLFADAESGGGGAQGAAEGGMMEDHFSSHERGQSGISVHVVRGVWRAVEC